MLNVEIITIGDELLIGQVTDTNSPWMGVELNLAGFDVRYKTTVGDNEQDILDAVGRAFSRASVVLLTGGIGPTKDDITKKTLCRYFGSNLVFDEDTLENVMDVVANNRRALNGLTRSQAYVPDNCTVIQNRVGTAPITWFEREGRVLVSMPGVPYEMKWAMTNEILPRLSAFFHSCGVIRHRTFWVKNYSESGLALLLEGFENELPEAVKLAYLPTSGLIRLRLTAKGESAEIEEIIRFQSEKLKSLLAGNIVSEEDSNLEFILHKILKDKGLSLSVAESCTGGYLSSLFTAIPGCSAYYKGGAVTYANEAKLEILGVSASDLSKYGAVSREVVEQMASGTRHIFHSDCSIATSGIAGPDGGTAEKPVGTVWIAASFRDKLVSELYHFSKSRESNIQRAANNGMRMLLELL
ncbi:MAG: CinA family nicotinamide mononucleotide deamidase-related protein [Dysgonamonadaceae bacterium]|jgi:nicotinamide-nucleotide amidase|nr:CinA family nicotinamide mononucleotide deamidase-related protein [Dysgonamonadaceae bacterium]